MRLDVCDRNCDVGQQVQDLVDFNVERVGHDLEDRLDPLGVHQRDGLEDPVELDSVLLAEEVGFLLKHLHIGQELLCRDLLLPQHLKQDLMRFHQVLTLQQDAL
jgi:hypothetical protein